jgi:hypothetical protein
LPLQVATNSVETNLYITLLTLDILGQFHLDCLCLWPLHCYLVQCIFNYRVVVKFLKHPIKAISLHSFARALLFNWHYHLIIQPLYKTCSYSSLVIVLNKPMIKLYYNMFFSPFSKLKCMYIKTMFYGTNIYPLDLSIWTSLNLITNCVNKILQNIWKIKFKRCIQALNTLK